MAKKYVPNGRLRFQDIPGGFDPSIADVWSVRLN
jgi:hypothetical protein